MCEFLCSNCGSNKEKKWSRIGIGPVLPIIATIRHINFLLGKQKCATVKECANCGSFEVTCPFCKRTTSQKQETRNYICPYCFKKSYFEIFIALFDIFLNKYNKI
jgi:hypothetical protein